MSKFTAIQDNPFAGSLVNIYRDGEYWASGEARKDGLCKIPLRNPRDEVAIAPFYNIEAAEEYLNKYQGLTKGAAMHYLKVS